MVGDAIREAGEFGQSVWYDGLGRALIRSGRLGAMVAEGLTGVTSNPTIFSKAIAGSADYDEALRALVGGGLGAPKELYERLAIEDIRGAADLLRPVYERTDWRDGYASLEVSPLLAHDTEGTIAEARRLFRAVARDNVMIKVPATPAGIPAITRLVAEGVNVNVTLLFSLGAYQAVADAYLAGLEELLVAGGEPREVQSVASFFLSRIDAAVDERLDAASAAGDDLRGRVAIANAKLAHEHYRTVFSGPRWDALADTGACTQRLLWASTGPKNPAHPKLMYAEALIGPDTIATMPPEIYREFRDRGRAAPTLAAGLPEARRTIDALGAAGISLGEVTDLLLEQGVALFSASFQALLATIERKRRALLDELGWGAHAGP
jgi:transaldolase/glucose-6-phosphate isomerase